MSELKVVPESKKGTMRILLDEAATRACESMLESLKNENTFVKLYPSEMISFIVSHYFKNFYGEESALLVSQFFDSKAYLLNEMKRPENFENPELALKNVTAYIESIRSKKVKKRVPRKSNAES